MVPWGMDPSRFPWPPADGSGEGRPSIELEGGVGRPAPTGEPAPSTEATPSGSQAPVVTLFMAAVQGEFIKGYHIAHEACRLLRQTRSDFELVVTFDPPGRIDEFTCSVGWCSQADLPGIIMPPTFAWCRRSPRKG